MLLRRALRSALFTTRGGDGDGDRDRDAAADEPRKRTRSPRLGVDTRASAPLSAALRMDLCGEGDPSGACSCSRLRRGVDGGGSAGTASGARRAVGGGDERCFRFILGAMVVVAEWSTRWFWA